jgi:hypothetical protein
MNANTVARQTAPIHPDPSALFARRAIDAASTAS